MRKGRMYDCMTAAEAGVGLERNAWVNRRGAVRRWIKRNRMSSLQERDGGRSEVGK